MPKVHRLGRGLVVLALGVVGWFCPAARAQEGLVTEDEKNTVEIFRKVSASVAFINTAVREADFFSFNVQEVPRGSGSGFVWDAKGHVVTNFHVIDGSSSQTVTLPGKSEDNTFPARVVGVDPSRDIAVLRIEAPEGRLKPVTVGSSDTLLVGQKVLAIGNPFGFDQTLTTGVVSALGRSIDAPNGRKIHDVIQTDASINPGNSGGPLLDSRGRVVGVNSAIYSPAGASAGIGFSVPINTVKRIVPQLIANGRIKRVGLGVTTIPDGVAKSNGIKGVIVAKVAKGGAADRAGLKGLSRGRHGQVLLGDVIVGFNERDITVTDELFEALDDRRPGESASLGLLRDGKRRSVKITLQEIDER